MLGTAFVAPGIHKPASMGSGSLAIERLYARAEADGRSGSSRGKGPADDEPLASLPPRTATVHAHEAGSRAASVARRRIALTQPFSNETLVSVFEPNGRRHGIRRQVTRTVADARELMRIDMPRYHFRLNRGSVQMPWKTASADREVVFNVA